MLAEITPAVFYWVAWVNVFLWFGIFVAFLAKWTKPSFWPVLQKHLTTYGYHYAFFAALLSMLASLWLSDVAGYPPCKMCWYQRIAMYPLVIMLAVAIWKKESVRVSGFLLAGIGFALAAYHYFLQRLSYIGNVFGWDMSVYAFECGTVDCSSMILGYWGFYSIPLMALCGFAVVLTGLYFSRK